VGCVATRLHEHRQAMRGAMLHENAFHTSFTNSPIGLALVDKQGMPSEVNDALCVLLGYTSSELKTHPFAELVHPEDLPAGRDLFLKLIKGDLDHYEVTKRLVHKGGRAIPVHMKVYLARDEEGQPLHTITIINRQNEPTGESFRSSSPI